MFKILTDKLLEPPLQLMKLVKMTLSLPHGQAGVESGFSNTKSIVKGRESLNHTSVKPPKLVQCALRGKGGAQHVPITTSMMNAVRGANVKLKYLQELEEEKKKKRKAQEEAEAAAEAKKRKDEIDLAKKTWGEKRDDLKNQISVVEEQIKWANKEFQAAVTQGQKTDNAQMKNKCFKQLGDCQERIKEKTEALSQLQAKMAKLMEKKPKEK